MIRDYFKLAVNAIAKRKLRSYLTMIGVFIGIAAVVSLIGLGEGLRVAIVGQLGSFAPDILSVQAGGIQAGPPGTGVVNPLTLDDIDDINDIRGVKLAFSRLIRIVRMEFNDMERFQNVVSLTEGESRKEIERIMQLDAAEGRMLKDSDTNKIIMGHNFADTSRYGKQFNVGDRVKINGRAFQVVGIMEKKGSFIIDNVIAMNEEVLRDLVDDHKKVDVIAVVVNDRDEINEVKERIEKKLRQTRNVDEGEEDFAVETPQNALSTINSALFAVQLFVYIIAGISLLVGGIGIMNTMYTAVLERTKEIGVMKSIGAKNSTIFLLFFIESGLMGTVGGIIGVVLGVAIAVGLSAIGKFALGSDLIQAHFSLFLLLGALAFSFLLGSIAGITPAMGAARLHPVDALRHKR